MQKAGWNTLTLTWKLYVHPRSYDFALFDSHDLLLEDIVGLF